MKIAKVAASALVVAGLFMGSRVAVQAQVLAQTWVSGTVVGSDSSPVNSGSVFVQCNGFSRNATIQANGTYAVSFPQTECITGNTVTASASTSEGSGANSAPVQDTNVNGPVVDLDIAVIDISVPEFGLIGGIVSAMGAAGAFMYMRAKQLV